jgi:predicted DCC family thiol-disulfide oxidoreductase YuxK
MNVKEVDETGDRLLVIFDGHCGFCYGWVRWLVRRDRRDRLRFAAFGSPPTAALEARHARLLESGGSPETILVFRNPFESDEQVLVRFAATLAVLRELPLPWPAVAKGLGCIPGFLGDSAYRLMARWRYRIRGRLESCPLPTAEERERFL